MFSKSQNVGTCFICHQTLNHILMERHLNDCVKKEIEVHPADLNTIDIFRIKIISNKTFWLYVEMPAHASLQYLDDFLRAVWLECCGHLSEFKIKGGVRFHINQAISQFFKKGTQFSYEYDFGSTTLLEGEVIDCYEGQLHKKVRFLARNNMPTIKCTTCSANPKAICSYCYRFCCTECVKKHRYRKEGMLPVVNSPRIGVCGYTGESAKSEQAFIA